MGIESNSESNYYRLRTLAVQIDQPNGFPTGGGRIRARDLVLQVLARDDNLRPSRIALSGNRVTTRANRASIVEIHLYHDFELAIPIACRSTARDYCAFDDSGRVIAWRLSKLNELLAARLKGLRGPALPLHSVAHLPVAVRLQ